MLSGKTALITGATKGIGRAIAEKFALNGAKVIVTGRDQSKIIETVASLSGEGHLGILMDVSDLESIKEAFARINSEKISIDILVNNAGVMVDATLQMVKPELVEHLYRTNVFGTIYPSQFAIKSFIRKRSGSIINLSSIIGTNGNLGQTIYGSSKSAIIGFTKSLSKELAPLNIRVNALAPGFIDTDMTRALTEEQTKALLILI